MKITIQFTEGGEEIPEVACSAYVMWDDNCTQAHDVWEHIQRVGRAAMLASGFSASVVSEVTEE